MAVSSVSLPDRYRPVRHVASGGMGGVWEAEDTVLGRHVAVKLLSPAIAEDPVARARFGREARAAAALSGLPGVVTIHDVGEHAGRPFIVMELLDGGTVADALKRRPEEARARALEWLEQAAEALDAAHARGVVHRDIKPANLLLNASGRLVIADFGIARLAEGEQFTETGQVLGTAAYIAPEQALGQPATAATDLYSLGVVAFELLTGRRPFEAEHFAAQAQLHVHQPPPAASQINPELPPGVDAVLGRALAKAPEDRWPSTRAFARALTEAMRAGGAGAAAHTETTRPLPVVAPSPAPDAPGRRSPTPPRSAPPAAPAPRPRRRRWGPPAAAAGLALGLAAAALLVWDGGDQPDRPQGDERRAARTETARRPREQAPARTTAPATPPPATTAAPPPTGNASELNARGYALMQKGDHAGAVPLLQDAVAACGDSAALDPCGYALYNLGAALRRSGRPGEAIPYLERRLEGWDFKDDVVSAELEAARREAGQAPEEDAGNGGDDGSGNGRGRGKGKGKDG